MQKLVKFSEWQDMSGNWHVAYTDSFKENINNFVIPARVMEMSLDKYYKWVIDNFDPIIHTYNNKGLIIFSWTDYSKAHSLLLKLNREARNKNFLI